MDWTNAVLRWMEPFLGRPTSPLAVKEIAWRLINWVIRCGSSNPISFAVRPLVMSSKFKAAVGINLVILVIIIGFLEPLPTMADNTGGQVALVNTTSEVSLSTPAVVQLPLKSYYLSQRFWAWHSGIDMATQSGEPIRPIMSGVVSKVEKNWFGYGNMVVVRHENAYESLYAHLSTIMVTQGQEVYLDTVLGLVGSTGRSTGPHLHLEIHENGKIVNPEPILGVKTN